MTADQESVLSALYGLEEAEMQKNEFDTFFTADQVAANLSAGHPRRGDAAWTRQVLEGLWTHRRVLQVAPGGPTPSLVEVMLSGRDGFGQASTPIPVERDDARGYDGNPNERVALYAADVATRYRSRIGEIARLLSRNYSRFRMLPSTGLLRYERRSQRRPEYDWDLAKLKADLCAQVAGGRIEVPRPDGADAYQLAAGVTGSRLAQSIEATLGALEAAFQERGLPLRLATFQVRSLCATLVALYCRGVRPGRTGQIITAGVGSGKSYAFQLPALVHAAYRALGGAAGIATLLLYPRVVLASNQFQELQRMVERTSSLLGRPIAPPVLDAGGRLGEQAPGAAPVRGQMFRSIQAVYQGGGASIIISNLDTLANRIVHPEANQGLTADLDLVVLDEVHLLSGLYGAHARMLLKRLCLLRRLHRSLKARPGSTVEQILSGTSAGDEPYFVGASATIAEPRQHLGRLVNVPPESLTHVEVASPVDTGFVHHLFLRQRPESSSQTAAVNAVSCLVHNRREGTFREYYQRTADPGAPLRMDELSNPVLPNPAVSPTDPKAIHKTLGFCDSLDGVNRWADLLTDNERTKAQSMSVSPSPSRSIPYFARFQEPLWRAVLHNALLARPPSWTSVAIAHYGTHCRSCKQGIQRTIARIPPNLRQAQADAFRRLWDFADANNKESYLALLGVDADDYQAACFGPVVAAAQKDDLTNLDRCPFFQSGFCWWWSHDHLGSNHPKPVAGNAPLNGVRKPRVTRDGKYHPVNGIRVLSFTSKSRGASAGTDSINDIFQGEARDILRHRDFGDPPESCSMIIGSPRLEVGVDLSRVCEGVTFRAMRDPASLQQKAGRVGRELGAESLVVHLVTENARDHYYFRNPRVLLDPDYLQPIPLHEDNRIVARNHFFMAVFDFLALHGALPQATRPADDGDRVMLINDHRYANSFRGWDKKLQGVWQFLFGTHPRAAQNRANLEAYVQELGAGTEEIAAPGHVNSGPAAAPCSSPAGVLDVLRHDFGPDFFFTPIPAATGPVTPAQLAAWDAPPPSVAPTFPRQAEFVRSYHTGEAKKNRSYFHNLLTLPLFRKGIPGAKLPGNQPYLWAPNLFEAVGREYVRVFSEISARLVEQDPEPLSTVLGLLLPGTVTYRYGAIPMKVPVSRHGAGGLDRRQKGLEDVLLLVQDPDSFEPAGCGDVQPTDLPPDFPDRLNPVPVYRPRKVTLEPSHSEPIPHIDGLLADNDERDLTAGPQLPPLATPPRCFPLRWYRVESDIARRKAIPDRMQLRFRAPAGAGPVPATPRPPVLELFSRVDSDGGLGVTQFVWGLDRQFMSRSIEAARLLFRSGDSAAPGPVALGQHFEAPGLRFELDLAPGSPIASFLDTLWATPDAPAHQAALSHVLRDFLKENARAPADANGPPWAEQARPSTFVVRNLQSIIWFHLLEKWFPSTQAVPPTGSPRFAFADLVGVFTPGHPLCLDRTRFEWVCRVLAGIQNAASSADRAATLLESHPFFAEACARLANLTVASARTTLERLLLNSLGIAMHSAAVRLSGAETSDLSYFYVHRPNGTSEVLLFDSDELGNGTCDLVRRNFHVSGMERVLSAREAALGGSPDPLPSNDFVDCLEEELQECGSGQASHLGFHALTGGAGCWKELDGQVSGERRIAGAVFDFIHTRLNVPAYDDLAILQLVPEFVAHASTYASRGATPLVPSHAYPTYQALESAFGFCVDGCVSCIVAPEVNLQGVLAARETVSKLLLDSLYREVVVARTDPVATAVFPATGPARSVLWPGLAAVVASCLGTSPTGVAAFDVELDGRSGTSTVTVFPATTPGSWSRVFRPSWRPAAAPEPRVRPRMPL